MGGAVVVLEIVYMEGLPIANQKEVVFQFTTPLLHKKHVSLNFVFLPVNMPYNRILRCFKCWI